MPISICRATTKDIPLLVEMMREFYSECDYILDQQWATDSFTALLRNASYGTIWIASHDDKPAGYVVLSVRFSMEYGGLEGFIDDLFVYPKHRRYGAGQSLLDALLEDCKQRKVLALHVEVGSDNTAAKALYNKSGLRVRTDDRQVLTAQLNKRTEER